VLGRAKRAPVLKALCLHKLIGQRFVVLNIFHYPVW